MPARFLAARPRAAQSALLSPWGIAGAAAIYAAAEFGVTLLAGNYFEWGRAEALLFHAFRPWILLAMAMIVARASWRSRMAVYAAAFLVAAASETLFVAALGASNPWPQMARGLAGGAILAGALDLMIQACAHVFGRWGRYVAAVLAAIVFLSPAGLRFYEAIVIEAEPGQAAERPDLMLMTALPIIWGETGAFDPASKPAASFLALKNEFTVRPLDYLDASTLGGGHLLLLAQPRALAPAELAALDAWVRRGGRALILTDPWLSWPSALPMGDKRRQPPAGLLGPILRHWGLRLEPAARGGWVARLQGTQGGERRLVMAAPGAFRVEGAACRVPGPAYLARCRVGSGEAILIADADLMRDALWAAPGKSGGTRAARLSDNPLVVADYLDELVGRTRPRIAGDVEWLMPDADRSLALLLALLPIAGALGIGLILRFKVRR